MMSNKKATPLQLCVGRAIVDPSFREAVFNNHSSPGEIATESGVPEAGVQALRQLENQDKEFASVIEELAEHVDNVVRVKFPAV